MTINELKNLIINKCVIKDGGNVKLGNMGTWAMLYGNCIWQIPEIGMCVEGSCGNHCNGCFNAEDPKRSECYVAKSYAKYTKRNEDGSIGNILTNECSVKLGHAYRTLGMRFFRNEIFEKIDGNLSRKKVKYAIIRVNESGELMDGDLTEFWCPLASNHPETTFYLYTKNYDEVRKAIKRDCIPSNLFILISIWHEYGIREYLEFEDHPQIKAFVVIDDEWTIKRYAENGIKIDTTCHAYNEKGKLNHNVTCDKCTKCFNYLFNVIGCYKH